jgi:glycosyltransferase involved in cell wall biosynthesis
MKIFYFAPADLQIARVDRQCIVRFCEALKKTGADVTLIAAKIRLAQFEKEELDLDKLYGIQTPFEIKLLNSSLQQTTGPLRKAVVRLAAYFIFTIFNFLFKRKKIKQQQNYIYFKNHIYFLSLTLARWFNKRNVKLIFEAHLPPKNKFQHYVLNNVQGIIANSNALATVLKSKYEIPENKVIGTHQGVNLEYVESIRISKEESRRRLNLPLDKKLVVYTGKVYYGYEEVDYFVEAAKLLIPGIEMVVVGGRADHVDRIKKKHEHKKNLRFVSFVPPAEIFFYQFAADMLLLYYPPGNPLNDFRSPGKLFDYMASKNPIIAADYPVLTEILNDGKNSLIIAKANAEALAQNIIMLASDEPLCRSLGEQAYQDVKEYTWDARARKISAFITSIKSIE